MTNPAWVVLFTKIAGLVTDTGGTTSHPAVLSREFGIPAVIGTSVATQRIVTGDRIRIDGTAGSVEILRAEAARPAAARRRRRSGQSALRPFAYERPTRLDDAIALLARGDSDARLLAGGTDLIIRLRDGTIRPRTVVDIKGIAELDGDIREEDGRPCGSGSDRDDGHRRATSAFGATSGTRRGQRPSSGPSRSGTGRRWPATSATPRLRPTRRRRSSCTARVVTSPGPAGTRRIPIDDFFVRSGVTTLAAGELVTSIELPRSPIRHGGRPCPADPTPWPRPRVGHAGLRGPC